MTSRGWSVRSAAQSRNDDRKPVGHGGDLVVLEHLGQRRRRDRPPAPHREHEPVAVAERPRRVEDLQCTPVERDPAEQRRPVLV